MQITDIDLALLNSVIDTLRGTPHYPAKLITNIDTFNENNNNSAALKLLIVCLKNVFQEIEKLHVVLEKDNNAKAASVVRDFARHLTQTVKPSLINAVNSKAPELLATIQGVSFSPNFLQLLIDSPNKENTDLVTNSPVLPTLGLPKPAETSTGSFPKSLQRVTPLDPVTLRTNPLVFK